MPLRIRLALPAHFVITLLAYLATGPPWSQKFVEASGTDVEASLSFTVPIRQPVAMTIANSVRYELNTEEGAKDFALLLPSGGHVVHKVSEDDPREVKTYTVTVFHQLKCLDIIRQETILNSSRPLTSSMMTRHCMNYLRQTLLCRPNLGLETSKDGVGTLWSRNAVCKDWTVLYEAAEKNHRELQKWSDVASRRP